MRSLILATLFGTLTLTGAEFLPLESGNHWTYREAFTGQEFTVSVGKPTTQGDQTYFPLTGYVNQQLLVRLDDSRNLYYLDQESGKDILLTSFEPFVHGYWEAPFRTCSDLGQTQEKLGTHEGPAGTFRDTLEILYSSRPTACADAGLMSEQYAGNIGMVRRIEQSFAGPRVFNLVRARVGRNTIEAAAIGRFTVTLDSKACAGSATVTMRLATDPALPLALEFPTSQEFDVVVRDSDGGIVYQWSRGRVFALAVHHVATDGELVRSATIPNPAIDCEAPARAYTIEAWLTGSPRFAATIPVSVVPPLVVTGR